MNKFREMIKTANIHANRITLATQKIKHLFPITAQAVTHLSENDLVWIELLTSRFGKLQDFLGTKLIDAFLEASEEPTQNLTMLDKINKLERLKIIESTELWREIRDARNHIAHEYPDNPELTAHHLNQIFNLAPKLIGFLNLLKNKS